MTRTARVPKEGAVELMGYVVEKQDEGPGPLQGHPQGYGTFAYLLTGKRGAQYGLLRYPSKPHLMYAVRASSGHVCGLKGNYTFSDEGGTLRVRS